VFTAIKPRKRLTCCASVARTTSNVGSINSHPGSSLQASNSFKSRSELHSKEKPAKLFVLMNPMEPFQGSSLKMRLKRLWSSFKCSAV